MTRDWNIIDDGEAAAGTPESPPVGLDSRLIHLIVEERRAANRTRIRRRVILPVALAIALAAAFRAATAWQTSQLFALACGMTAAIALVIAWRTWRKVSTDVVEPPATDPKTPPDFDALGGDGDDAASRLARMRDDR